MAHLLLRFDSPEALAAQVAERWIGRIADAGEARTTHRVALPGGRITRRFLEATTVEAARRSVGLDAVEFFWGDERCVPPDDAESNFRLADETLFKAAGIRAGQIHRIRGEIDPREAAVEAEATLRRVTKTQAGEQPVLDLVFLGMGEDGHVASLFPGAPESVTESRSTYLPVTGPKPPPRRISLTFAAILAAREVWVLASGAGKEDALRRSLNSGGTPLARVIDGRPQTLVFTDLAA